MHARTWRRIALSLMLALTLAIPAMAQVRSPLLSDSQEPGSVLVFPKFLAGTTANAVSDVGADAGDPGDGPSAGGEPRSAFEIGITCPKNVDGTPGTCAEGTKVKLRAHWVCPGSQELAEKFICKETNFDLFGTVT